jgi:hypothetical protein
MRRRPHVSGSYPGVQLAAIVVILGLWTVACSPETPRPASHEDAGGMDVRASRSASEEGPQPEEGPEPRESAASPPAPTIPAGTRVPDIRTMEFEDAVITLRTLGMDFGFVIGRTDAAEPWEVLEQWPKPGARPPIGGRISMSVSMGPSGNGVASVVSPASPRRMTSTSPTAWGRSSDTELVVPTGFEPVSPP